MNSGNGSVGTRLGVLADIIARLAAITPEQVAPLREAPPVEEGDHVVATANDDIKRYFTLCGLLKDAYNEKVRAHNEVVAGWMAVGGREPVVQRAKFKAELGMEREFFDIVHQIAWLEVERQYPELTGKPGISIGDDWSLFWREGDGSEMDITIIGHGVFVSLDQLFGGRAQA